jgi:hypothetical protein
MVGGCSGWWLAGLWFVGLVGYFAVFAFDGDAEGAEEVHVVFGEGGGAFGAVGQLGGFAFFDFVEADGGLEHEEDVESVLADILDNSGDLFAFDDGLMDGFTELLDQFAQARCHDFLRQLPAVGRAQGGKYLTTLLGKRHSGNWHLQ